MSSPAQIAANRCNAQLSTGPTSPEGKTRSSKNAVKTGLTGRTILLATDDADLYEKHCAAFRDGWMPVNDAELTLVQALADTEWRLARIPALEAGIYAVARVECADLFPDVENPAERQLMIESKILMLYRRDLSNLSLQETRLRRQREKDMAALNQLQVPRQESREKEKQHGMDELAKQYVIAVRTGKQAEFIASLVGSEFSLDEIEPRAMELVPDLFADYERELLEDLGLVTLQRTAA